MADGGKIIPINIEDEMKTAYIDYSMSVIVSRALPGLVGGWNVILLRTFFFDLPSEIYEAAYMDGCSEMRMFWQIVIPMSKPALATIGLFKLLTYWNSWFPSMVYIQNESKYMLQYLLFKILREAEQYAIDAQAGMLGAEAVPMDTVKFAMAVMVAGPMMLVFPFFQKYFVKGISVGAVKG